MSGCAYFILIMFSLCPLCLCGFLFISGLCLLFSDFRVVGVLGVFGEAPQRARDRLGGEMKCPVTVNFSFELAMSTSPFCESACAFQGFTGLHRGQAQLELARHGSIKG